MNKEVQDKAWEVLPKELRERGSRGCCLREYLELNTRIIKNMDKTELVDLMLKDIEKMTKANEDALQYHNVRTILNYGDYNFDDYANRRSNQSPA